MVLGNPVPGLQKISQVKFDVLGMAITEIDHISALRSGMEMSAGLIVVAVRWGGEADLAGVMTGDIITEVDGKAIGTIRDLDELLSMHEPHTPYTLLFRRVGAWRHLSITYDEYCPEEGMKSVLNG